MTSTVKITAVDSSEITLNAKRVDERVTVKPIVSERVGQEAPIIRATRSRRRVLFIITGMANQTEKNELESASKTWWTKESGGVKGRITLTWGAQTYQCAITKCDFVGRAETEKYEYLMELEEGAF